MCDRKPYQVYTIWLLLAVILPSIPLLKRGMGTNVYILPLYWGLILAVILLLIPRMHVPGRLCIQGTVLGYAASGAVIFLALRFVAGAFLKQLTASPYDTSASGIFYNAIAVFPALGAREMIRAYGLGAVWRNSRFRMIMTVFITILMTLTELNFSRIMALNGTEAIFIYMARDCIPLFTRNCLMTTLVFYGGAPAGIAYWGLIEAFQKCFPFLPELPWLADSAIGIVFPVLYTLFTRDRCQILNGDKPVQSDGGTVGYLAALFLSVTFSWFCVGVFNIYPSVVLTGSMEPGIYPGDVVLIRKVLEEKDIYSLAEGDVINFKREDITVTHRIAEVIRDEAGNVSYRTKGDNNHSADDILVAPNDVKGRAVGVVPKAGTPVLIIKSDDTLPEGVIDDGREETEQ